MDLARIISNLNDVLAHATEANDELESKISELQEALADIESFIDNVNDAVSGLENIADVSVDIDRTYISLSLDN